MSGIPLRNVDNASPQGGSYDIYQRAARFAGFLEHAAIFIGLVLMVIGLGLGVTMIMLPVGVVIGLIGVALRWRGFLPDWISGRGLP
jgi:hypothetical protein